MAGPFRLAYEIRHPSRHQVRRECTAGSGMTEATIVLDDPQRVLSLFGPRDQHLRAIRETLGVTVLHRDGEIRVAGEEGAVAKAKEAFGLLHSQLVEQGSIEGDQV